MPTNKYVDFVSDEYFIKCVKHVCDTYSKIAGRTPEEKRARLTKNALDSFKMVFDIMNRGFNLEKWVDNEHERQADKTVNNKIGEFHQMLLGGVNGWTYLGKGHSTGMDLKKNDDTIFIELKNKFNTVKGENFPNLFDKLKKVVDENSNTIAYYAYITAKNGTSGERVWRVSQRSENPRIMEIWGSKVYELITGKSSSLEKTWSALPTAITDLIPNATLNGDEQTFKKFFNDSFKK